VIQIDKLYIHTYFKAVHKETCTVKPTAVLTLKITELNSIMARKIDAGMTSFVAC
jgi:hypothetical protein